MCEHRWTGDRDGVFCPKCGQRMTAGEYRKSLEPKKEPKPAKPKKESADE